MNALDDGLICRLCSVKIEDDKLMYIFEEEHDLVQKINDTLSLQVSPNDNYSEYICFDCCEKVINHYDFMQSILKVSKKNVSTRNKSLYEFNRNEKINTNSKVCNDMIYTCPNCNIDLMFIINDISKDNNTTLEITLTAVDQTEKSMQEKDTQAQKNTINLNNSCIQKSSTMDDEMESSCIVNENINEIGEGSLVLQNDDNCSNAITCPNRKILHRTSENTKKRFQENVILEADDHRPMKLQKLETQVDTTQDKPNVISLSSDDNNADDLIKIKSICNSVDNEMNEVFETENTDNLVKIVSNGNMEWLNKEAENTNDKEDDSAGYMSEAEREQVEKDSTQFEDICDVRCGPRIICNLCGTRFLSPMKYEFHMERHELNKMDKFVCTVCDKETTSESLLWDHYFHMHKSSVRYCCVQCGKVYERNSRLKTHQKIYKHFGVEELHIDIDSVQQGKLVKREINCSLCREPITENLDPKGINDLVTCAACEDSSFSLMVDGIEMKAITPRQFHCSKCPKHFVRKERLEFHEMRHNENMNEFICSTCGKKFSAENSLYEHHLFVHKGARPHICEKCGKSFQLKTRLKEHIRIHTGERPFQCDVCGQRCMTSTALKLHRKTHFSTNRYSCELCDKSFSKKQNMNEHLEKHWKDDQNNVSQLLPQLFRCPVCMIALPTYRMLKYHMIENHQTHHQDPLLTEQKPWHQCNKCHEKFKHQMSLKAHKERVHEGIRSPIFQCDICKVTFKIKQMLINHIRNKHEGEKRYKCAKCRKGFNDTKSLYNHILLHTGRKPFECEYCNLSFRRKDSRDHHRRTHTGERPFQCADCGQMFSTYNSRTRHRKTAHGEGGIECPDCGQKCSSKEIRIHLNKHLGEKLNKLQSA